MLDMLQTPALATALLMAFTQVLNPAISFSRDMQPHCSNMRQNWFVPVVVIMASTLLYVEVLYPKGFRNADILYQQSLPFSFRLKLLVFYHIGMVVLTVIAVIMRRLNKRELEATQEASTQLSAEAAASIEAASRHNSISISNSVALRRNTESADVNPWLRHTTSSVGEMVELLPRKQ